MITLSANMATRRSMRRRGSLVCALPCARTALRGGLFLLLHGLLRGFLRRGLQCDARRSPAVWQFLHARQIVGTPQVPGCQAAMRFPALAELRQRARPGHAAQAIGEAKAVTHAEI